MIMKYYYMILIIILSCFFTAFSSSSSILADDQDYSNNNITISSVINSTIFNQMLGHSMDSRCPSNGFYTYDAFISAATSFPAFGTTGDNDTQKREIAAFLGQTSHETTGGWPNAPDGPYAWGYCIIIKNKIQNHTFCNSRRVKCPPGKSYYMRGPIQLIGSDNYYRVGEEIGEDLLNNPDLVETNATISFKTAIWFWMTDYFSTPSCHDVIVGKWKPSADDKRYGRLPGYGTITNIFNGESECGRGGVITPAENDRIQFYKRYCNMFGIYCGGPLDCRYQDPFGIRILN